MKLSSQTCKFPRNLSSLKPLASIEVQHQRNQRLASYINGTVGRTITREITYTYKQVSCCWKSSLWRNLSKCKCTRSVSLWVLRSANDTILHDILHHTTMDAQTAEDAGSRKFLRMAIYTNYCWRIVLLLQKGQTFPGLPDELRWADRWANICFVFPWIVCGGEDWKVE